MATWISSWRSRADAWRRLVRARRLVEAGAALEWYAPDSSDTSTRAARLYRRALRMVGAVAGSASTSDARALAAAARRGTAWLTLLPERVTAPRVRRRVTIVAAASIALALLARPVSEALSRDLAAGAPWRSSSIDFLPAAEGSNPSASPGASFFVHTRQEAQPFVVVDLGAARKIGRVQVSNRSDCCAERAVPLVLETSLDGTTWRQIGRRRMLFDTWTHRFSRVTARYVRVRVERPSVLHLAAIRVFA